MRKVGFTGTQSGMSAAQKRRLSAFLSSCKSQSVDRRVEFHHGDCVGADEEAHAIALTAGCYIVIHPPVKEEKRAHCERAPKTPREDRMRVSVLPPVEYLARNVDIVLATEYLIAAPRTNSEVIRSGTWATIRAAERMKRPCEVMRR